MNKGLQTRAAQTHTQRLTQPLPDKVLQGEFDPSFVVARRLPVDKGPVAYRTFRDKQDHSIKVVLKPRAN